MSGAQFVQRIQIGVLGAKGRMGRRVLELLNDDFAAQVNGIVALDKGDERAPLWECDVVIDFASAEAMAALTREALAHTGALPAFVVGSTGWTSEPRALLDQLAMRASVLVSANFSTGVAALNRLLRDAGPLLHKLGYSPVLVETHHRHKKDAPSGTALLLQRTIEGAADDLRCQMHSVRAGEIIGDHEVTFYGPADHLTFGHFAQDRSVFARGAIEAALWLARKRGTNSPLPGHTLTIDDYLQEIIR